MRIVDAQCHVSTVWYEPVDTLLAQMDRNGVQQAVLIQMLGQFDNAYQQACAARNPDRLASVVAVDPAEPGACKTLAALAAEGAAGVRLRPDARSSGSDPLAIWRAAADLGLPVSCVGTAEKFGAADFFELIAALPELTIVLEHLGGTSQAGATDLPARRRVFEAAQFPNVCLKLPGLGELVPRPALPPAPGLAPRSDSSPQFDPSPQSGSSPQSDASPAQAPVAEPHSAQTQTHPPAVASPTAEVELALHAFGPERLMWGSDFPVVGSHEGYRNALEWPRRAVAAVMPGAEASVFADTARRVFQLN